MYFVVNVTNCYDSHISDNRCNQNSSVTNELQSNTNNGLNTQPVQQPSTVPSQSKSDNVQESNDCNLVNTLNLFSAKCCVFLAEQLNQISDTVDSRNTRSKSKGKSISDRVTLEEASSDKEMSQTNVDILNKSDTESTSDCPQSVNNAPTIMQPVVRLQRISSEVIYYRMYITMNLLLFIVGSNTDTKKSG